MLELFNINYLLETYGYIGIFTVVFLESGIFFALPGDSLLFTVGLFAASGFLDIYLVIALIFISTFFGAVVGYEIGVYLPNLRKFSFFRLILKEKNIDKAHDFFEKYGKVAVIFSRFVPIVRTFTPIGAGIARMNYSLFLKYSFFGSLLWSTIVTLVGYFFGHIFPGIKDYMHFVVVIVVLLSIVPIFVEIWKNKKSKNKNK